MLIKITNYCSMGCSHCMEDSTVAGQHMTRETFLAALELTARLEATAWQFGFPRRILISGGEATEHPDVLWFLETVMERGLELVLITNGAWLADPDLRAKILRPEWPRLLIQVTNDPRFYPRPVKLHGHDDRIVFVPKLTVLVTLGRMKKERAASQRDGVPVRRGPPSFNLRSLTRSMGDVRAAITHLRASAVLGKAGNCTPSISQDDTLVTGETNSCFPIGDVHSTPEQVTRALIGMQCNKCGLVDGLTQREKLAIGEARILPP